LKGLGEKNKIIKGEKEQQKSFGSPEALECDEAPEKNRKEARKHNKRASVLPRL
jgi:hypothetical protein